MAEKRLDPKILKKSIDQYGRETINQLVRVYRSLRSSGQAKFLDTLEARARDTVTGVETEIIGEDYIKFIDEGRKPGTMPPLQDIIDWTRRVGIDEEAAFPIARHIGRFGVDPLDFIDPAIRATVSAGDKALEDGLVKAVDKAIDAIIEKHNLT